jgi:tetrahydromethanopterin S-methyltransferase subunit C
VSKDEWPKAVWVKNGIRVFDGVIVAEAVIVGVAEIRRVAVGVEVSVLVGMVSVGKGPSSAFAVPTIAVFILSAWLCEAPPRLEAAISRKVTAYTTKIRPIHKTACNKICRGTRFSFFTMAVFLHD